MMNTQHDITRELTRAGIRPSAQRIAVMRYLSTHFSHPTVDEIFQSLKAEYPTMSRTTVYNTLRLLVDHGLAIEIDIEPGVSRFDGKTEPHGHFQCQRCGAIIDFELPNIAILPANIEAKEIQVYAKGECSQCRRAARS